MTTLQILGLVVALIIVAALLKKNKDKDKPTTNPVTPPVVTPTPQPPQFADIPTGPWVYGDDMVLNLNQDEGGDYNAPQDLACVLAVAEKFNSLPEFIVVSEIRGKGTGKAVAEQIVAAGRYNIPVYSGAPTDAGGSSEASQKLSRRSKQGVFSFCLGGPATDLHQALLEGAHAHNIHLFALLKNTWNEHSTPNRQASSDYVQSHVPNKRQIFDPEFRILLNKHAGPYNDTEAFIQSNKDGNPMWALANGNFVMHQNRVLNNHQSLTAGSLRIADVITVLDYFGHYNHGNPNGMLNVIQHGLDIMEARLRNS